MTGEIWLFYFSSIAFSQKTYEMNHYMSKVSACLIVSFYKCKNEEMKTEEIVIHGIFILLIFSYLE